MSDLMFYCSAVVGIGILLVLVHLYERRGRCQHQWDRWVQSETDYAYVQQRICSKCGVAETEQFKKFGPDK